MDAQDNVLVVLVSSQRDMELVRYEHWYRIPQRRAPRHLTQARYLGFYLPSAFGNDKWSIREYAPVRGHELVRRLDLFPNQPDHPRAQDVYLKIQLGPLLALPHPIASRIGRRVLFIWTTGERFSSAVELNDLLSTGQADDILWAELKTAEIPAERHVTVRDGRYRYRVDYWIACALGDLVITLGDSTAVPAESRLRALCFSEDQVIQNPSSCAHQITRFVRELGNPKYASEHTS